MTFHTNLHLVLRFWNQVLTCASVILRLFARAARSALARYFCRWKRFSNSHIWTLEKEVRGFFRLGGVRFWYGCPILRVTANGTRAAAGRRDSDKYEVRFYTAADRRFLCGDPRPNITEICPVRQQCPVYAVHMWNMVIYIIFIKQVKSEQILKQSNNK